MRFLRHFKNKVYNNLFKLEKILHRIVLLIDDLLTPSGFKRITKSAFRKLKKKIKDLIGAFFYKIGDFLYTRVEATIEWIKLYFVQTKHLLLAPIFFWKEKYKMFYSKFAPSLTVYVLYLIILMAGWSFLWLGSFPFVGLSYKTILKKQFGSNLILYKTVVNKLSFKRFEYSPEIGFFTDLFPQPFYVFMYPYSSSTKRLNIDHLKAKAFVSKNMLLYTDKTVNLATIDYNKTLVVIFDSNEKIKSVEDSYKHTVVIQKTQFITKTNSSIQTKNIVLSKDSWFYKILKFVHMNNFVVTKDQIIKGMDFFEEYVNTYSLENALEYYKKSLSFLFKVFVNASVAVFVLFWVLNSIVWILVRIFLNISWHNLLLVSVGILFWLFVLDMLLNILVAIKILPLGIWVRLLLFLHNPFIYVAILLATILGLKYFHFIRILSAKK